MLRLFGLEDKIIARRMPCGVAIVFLGNALRFVTSQTAFILASGIHEVNIIESVRTCIIKGN